MKLVCIGDSITYGYGVSSKCCWVELIKKHFNIDVINKGINGDTTCGILSRSYRDIIEEKPDYAIYMAGTNDILMNRPVKSIEDNIKLLINEAKENNIIPIIALQPPIVAALAKTYWDEEVDYEKVSLNLEDYVNWLKAYSEDNSIAFVNFYDRFINENNINSLYSDGIHPNEDGHKLMSDAAAELLSKII
jgi:acyl-CoA thioesterase I